MQHRFLPISMPLTRVYLSFINLAWHSDNYSKLARRLRSISFNHSIKAHYLSKTSIDNFIMPSQTTAPSLRRVPASTSPEEVLQIIHEDGGIIVEKLADLAKLDKAWDEIQPHLHSQKHVGVTFSENSRRVTGLAGKSKTFACDLLMTPLYQKVAHLLLTKSSTTYWGSEETTSTSLPQLTNSMAFWLGPGSKAQGLHRDDQCHHTRHPAKYETELGIMFACTKSHKANGATNVIPFSHKWDDERKPTMDEATPAELERGDALMW